MNEVLYERLRPAQIRAAREACPVVYIPIGTLEWHGVHNPVGLDTLKAHALCVRCAEAGGGLVWPALWYGENRENSLLESSCGLNAPIAAAMGLPPDSFDPGYMGRSRHEQDSMYHSLLLHVLHQARSLGFRVAAICAGHYPLLDHAKAACHIFHQQIHHSPLDRKTIPWVFTGYELVREQFPFAGDHAGYWETSLLMALAPGMVDLAALPVPPEKPLGAGGRRPPHEANATDGEIFVRAIVQQAVARVRERLETPVTFAHHNLQF